PLYPTPLPIRYAAHTRLPERSEPLVHMDVLAAVRRRALRGHDDRRGVRLEAALDVGADPLDGERLLGNQDHVGATGHAGMQGDPTGVSAHDLDDQRAVMRFGGSVQPVDRLHGDVDRGVEPERVIGCVEVVVDRLRDADHVDAELREARRHAERVLAADREQGVDSELMQIGPDAVDAAVDLQRVGARGTQDGSAAGQDAAYLGYAERTAEALEWSLPPVA